MGPPLEKIQRLLGFAQQLEGFRVSDLWLVMCTVTMWNLGAIGFRIADGTSNTAFNLESTKSANSQT